MKQTRTVNTSDLLKQAKAAQHKEAYQIMNKAVNYRIGIGSRLPLSSSQTPTFFIEIIINLCPACNKVDLGFLEKALICLKGLEKDGYILTCQEGCISCEKLVPEQSLQAEFETVNALMEIELT
jgi:hypothetical protein